MACRSCSRMVETSFWLETLLTSPDHPTPTRATTNRSRKARSRSVFTPSICITTYTVTSGWGMEFSQVLDRNCFLPFPRWTVELATQWQCPSAYENWRIMAAPVRSTPTGILFSDSPYLKHRLVQSSWREPSNHPATSFENSAQQARGKFPVCQNVLCRPPSSPKTRRSRYHS